MILSFRDCWGNVYWYELGHTIATKFILGGKLNQNVRSFHLALNFDDNNGFFVMQRKMHHIAGI
jgi:hypothetical protein